jgi:hypothetical protein
MATSINGEMLRRGGWGRDGRTRTAAQDAFRPFDLGSYDRGELPVSFVTPKLISPLMSELAAEASAVERLTSIWSLRHVGLGDGDLFGVDENGKALKPPPDTPNGLIAERDAKREQDAADFNAGRVFG